MLTGNRFARMVYFRIFEYILGALRGEAASPPLRDSLDVQRRT